MSEQVIWNELGNVYMKIGAYDEAISAYQKAIEIDPGLGWPYSNLAFAYVQKGNYGEAISLYEKSLDLLETPNDRAICWNRLGDAYRHMQDYDNALDAYRKADLISNLKALSANEPGSPLVFPELTPEADQSSPATFLDANLETVHPFIDEESAGESTDAARVAEGLPDWLTNPSETSAYEVTISESAEQEDLSIDLAQTEKRLGEPAEWLRDLLKEDARRETRSLNTGTRTSKKNYPNVPAFLTSRQHEISFVEDQGGTLPIRGSEARPSVQNAYRTCHDTRTQSRRQGTEPMMGTTFRREVKTSASKNTGQTSKVGESGKAQLAEAQPTEFSDPLMAEIDRYRKIVIANETNDRAWDSLGKLYKLMGRYEESKDAFNHAIELAPLKADYHYNLGLVFAVQNRYREAIDSFLNALAQDKNYNLAHGALAGCYRRLGQDEEATRHIELAMPSMNEESEYNQACFNAICGNTGKAIELLRLAFVKQDVSLEWLQSDPDLECLRKDSRYQDLMREMHEMVVAA